MLTAAHTFTSRFKTNVSLTPSLLARLIMFVWIRPQARPNLGWMSERWLMEYRASHSK